MNSDLLMRYLSYLPRDRTVTHPEACETLLWVNELLCKQKAGFKSSVVSPKPQDHCTAGMQRELMSESRQENSNVVFSHQGIFSKRFRKASKVYIFSIPL